MNRCFQLASLADGAIMQNPKVGAILVFKGKILSEGYHQKFGGPHAEVNCIENCPEKYKPLIPNSTLFVSLEPCSHFGKTPPCADLILKHKISSVVVGSLDFNPTVRGNGIRKLEENGVMVEVLDFEEYQKKINFPFYWYYTFGRVCFSAKYAQSKNGKMGIPYRKINITPPSVNTLMHYQRSSYDAILVGFNTALIDSPSLTNRYSYAPRQPIRIIIDDLAQLDTQLLPIIESDTIILNNLKNDFTSNNIRYVKYLEGNLDDLEKQLLALGIRNVLIEGGSKTIQRFLAADKIQKIIQISNQQLMIEDTDAIASPQFIIQNFLLETKVKIENCTIQTYSKK